jgi:uncharacterized protein (TIGR02466 family)
MEKVELLPLFPSAFIYCDTRPWFDEIEEDFVEYCYELKENTPKSKSLHRSNRQNSWHSPDDLLRRDEFTPYKDFLIKCISTCFNSCGENIHYKLANAWIMINSKNGYNTKHVHGGCDLSGVLWIKSKKNQGNLNFENQNTYTEHTLLENLSPKIKDDCKMDNSYTFKPISGRMLLFPSHFYHDVELNKTREDRIALSFNIRITS